MNEDVKEVGAAVAEKMKAAKSGASWFYWIAGLSLVNSVAILAGQEWNFVIGLGVTQLMDAIGLAFAESVGPVATVVAFLFALVAAGITALFGFLGAKLKSWAFVVGMVLYGLDGLLVLVFGDWVGAGFHVLALYFIFTGYRHCRDLTTFVSRMPEPPIALTNKRITAAEPVTETT